MQTSNPKSRLVDAKFTKGGWTHNVLFRQKRPFKAPRIRNFCHYLHFSFTLDDNEPIIDATTLLGETRTQID